MIDVQLYKQNGPCCPDPRVGGTYRQAAVRENGNANIASIGMGALGRHQDSEEYQATTTGPYLESHLG
jgi:hypothetical protein